MYITLDMLAKALAILSTAAGLIATAVALIKRKAKQEAEIKELAETVEAEKTETAAVRRSCHEEQALIIFGLLACLKGLKEQGCDGPVTIAINKIETHINQKAHNNSNGSTHI